MLKGEERIIMQNILANIFKNSRQLTYKHNEVILRAEDTPSGVYYITSGWVKVYENSLKGEEKILMTLMAGDIFPCAWAVSDIPHNVNFAALDNTRLFRMPVSKFRNTIMSQPDYTGELLKLFAHQFYVLSDEVANLQYNTARERVILRILSLAENFGTSENGQILIKRRVPNEYIARSTSMSRETTSREMSRLVRERLIRHTDKEITILDISRLKQALCELDVPLRKPAKHKLSQTPVAGGLRM